MAIFGSSPTIFFIPRTIFFQALFLLTGVITTLGNQFSFYQGGAEKSTLIPVFFNFLGIALGGLIPLPEAYINNKHSLPHLRLCMIGLIDVLGNMLCLIGLIMVGSGTYQVIYSSVVLFTAFFARMFLSKVLSIHQMIALLVVSGGLALSAVGSASSAGAGDELSTSTLLLGCLITLIGSMCYGLVYAMSEGVLSQPDSPHPIQVQTMAGVWGFGAVALYFMFHTLPNFNMLVVQPITARGGSPTALVVTYATLAASAFFHAVAYFELIQTTGSVSTGVLAALRAVSVFAFSSIFFCDLHHEQCFNFWKGLSTIFVMAGLVYYGYSSKKSDGGKGKSMDLPLKNPKSSSLESSDSLEKLSSKHTA
eukprot:TRINITY_DN12853_c0_g1_i1.p1 TRINITY_DN12853_c0_g1~~TRINITY_DN12853_c0_g1_i1.p1  ORF type:complete len:365 (+),score=48.09 TRINITY_DN12853_c0_g1_i1:82-1176(+)